MEDHFFCLGVTIFLSTKPLHFSVCACKHVRVCYRSVVEQQRHSRPTGDTVHAAAAASERKATTRDAKKHTHTTKHAGHSEQLFSFLSFAFFIQASHLILPERFDFQLPCYYRDYYSLIDPLWFTKKKTWNGPNSVRKRGEARELSRGT